MLLVRSKEKLLSFCMSATGASGVDKVEVPVMERDSVTLNTGVKLNRQEKIKWYFNDTLIAHITGNLRYNCTDVQCNEGNERFRGRLKLDCYAGSLTIINIRNRHSGEYQLIIINGSDTGLIFNVSVHGELCLNLIVFIISVTFRAFSLYLNH